MENKKPIRTLGDYSRPSHEGYRNTIKLPDGNNVVPLRFDTINGCSFHRLRSEDPNQHLKDFLKLVDSLNLDVANRERTRLRLFQFSYCNQAINWLERLPAGSISTLEDLTTIFLAQFFPPGRTTKLQNDILMRTINQSAGGKLRDKNAKESWALLEDLALYDNESWNDPRDFAKPVKEISLPQDVPSTSDRRLIKLKNQVQRLMEAHLAPKSSVQVNKIASSCEICSGPHGTQYCMENPEQAFVEYASSRTDEAGGKCFMASQDARLSKFEAEFKQQQGEMTNKINTFLKAINDRMTRALPSDTVKNSKLNVNSSSSVFSARSYPMEHPQCSSHIYNSINYDDSSEEELEEDESAVTGELGVEYFEIIVGGCPSNLKIPCNIGHVHVEKSYIDLNSPINVMNPIQYNLIIKKHLEPREDPEGIKVISNFTRRIRGMHIFIGNFTYVLDFMIVKDISSVIDPRLSQVVLGRPSVEISNMTHDLTLGIVRFVNGTDKIAYKMPYKIKQFNSLLDFEKEHSKSVYFRNEDDKRRGVDYVVNKILGIYKECLELGPEYLTGLEEGEVSEEGGVT
ncbi:hypothetical protein Tco_0216750 [Tanacetum coccineum]